MEMISTQNKEDFSKVYRTFNLNSKGFLNEHHLYISLLICAAAVDCFSTMHFMEIVGPHVEVHPVIREFGFKYGSVAGPILGKIFQIGFGMLAVIYLRKNAKLILALTAVTYSWAGFANLLLFPVS